jgi:hypothetical protein
MNGIGKSLILMQLNEAMFQKLYLSIGVPRVKSCLNKDLFIVIYLRLTYILLMLRNYDSTNFDSYLSIPSVFIPETILSFYVRI